VALLTWFHNDSRDRRCRLYRWQFRARLVQANSEPLLNLDKLTYAGNLGNLASLKDDPRHVFVRGTSATARRCSRCSSGHKPRAIVNFAAESHVDRSIHGPAAFIETNVVATFALLDAVKDWWRAAAATSARVPLPARVDRRGVRLARARRSRVLRDDAVRAEQPVLGVEGGVRSPGARVSPHVRPADAHDQLLEQLRPAPVSREADPADDRQRARGKPLPVYGDGRNVRDWLYVGDHCARSAPCSRGPPGATYNVGGNAEMTNLDVVARSARAARAGTGRDYAARHVRQRPPGHDRRYAIDRAQIRGELGWAPAETFESGMRRRSLVSRQRRVARRRARAARTAVGLAAVRDGMSEPRERVHPPAARAKRRG
jgi:dTDP-glucose 4,6-dehydratase